MALKVYMAGKIGRRDWRHELVPALDQYQTTTQLTTIENGVCGGHDYVGPFFDDCGGHGMGHGDNTHGRGLGSFALASFSRYGFSHRQGSVFMQCCIQIERADVVFAWIDDVSAHGTLVEIGYARALQKEIWVAGYPIEDLWFAFAAATQVSFVQRPGDNPKTLWIGMLNRFADHIQRYIADEARFKSESAERSREVARFVEYAKQTRPNQLRGRVWSKTNGSCWYCGGVLNPFENFHIEHINPKSKGGADTLDNLAPACRTCNLSKGGMTIEQFRRKRGGGKFHFELVNDGEARDPMASVESVIDAAGGF